MGLGLADVTNEYRLITGTGSTGKRVDAYFELVLQKAEQVTQAEGVGGSATDVESLTADLSLIYPSSLISTGQILDVENVPCLPAISIQGDGTIKKGGDTEPGHPTLILNPKLALPVNTRLAKCTGSQVVNTSVINGVLIRNALGTAVGRMEIERLGLWNS